MTFDMSGKRVLVTGASSGLGQHFATVLAAAGADLVLAARRIDALETLGDRLARAYSCDVACIPLDVTDAASVERAIAQAGALDVLVNNAGVARSKGVLDFDAADYDFVMDANLRGAFLVATAVGRQMRGRGAGGAIVNTASILGLRQGAQLTAYAMSKAGLVQMTRQMGLEMARHGIRVNALAPGYFVTDINRDFLESRAGQAMAQRIPMRRFGQFEDLDGALLLLCSDASRYMTGTVIPVDGGHLVSSL